MTWLDAGRYGRSLAVAPGPPEEFGCAARLRLTPEERDGLLLAAGFPPESAQAPAIVPLPDQSDPSDRADRTDPVFPDEPPPDPKASPTKSLPWWLIVAAVVVAFLIAPSGLFYVFSHLGKSQSYPAAGQGETLIVVGSFSSDAKSPGANVGDRLQAALNREIQAARPERVRVASWPEEIRDNNAAASTLRRARATMVIGGVTSGDGIVATLTAAPAASRADELPLDALIAAPSSLRVKIVATSPDEARALALLTLSQLYVDRGDFDRARAALIQALGRPPADQEALAVLYLSLGYVYQVSKPPELDEAISSYGKATQLSEMPTTYLNRGLAYLRQNRATEWQADFARVLALQPNHAGVAQALCWSYALEKQPEQALS